MRHSVVPRWYSRTHVACILRPFQDRMRWSSLPFRVLTAPGLPSSTTELLGGRRSALLSNSATQEQEGHPGAWLGNGWWCLPERAARQGRPGTYGCLCTSQVTRRGTYGCLCTLWGGRAGTYDACAPSTRQLWSERV